MNRIALSTLAAGFLALAGASFAGDAGHKAHGDSELHKAMMEGMESMHSMKMTGDIDRDYTAMMIKHHEQANAMNKVLLEKGKNPQLKAMAEKMTAQQNKEIEELKRHGK